MKRLIKLAGLLVVVLGLVLWACSKETTEPESEPETDKEAIQLLIGENSSYFNTQTHYGQEDTTGGKFGVLSSPINTCFWYREIHPYPSIDITIDIVGDSAFVVWTGEYNGILHLFASDSLNPDSIIEYTKDFTDKGERHAVFKRLYPYNEDHQHRRG